MSALARSHSVRLKEHYVDGRNGLPFPIRFDWMVCASSILYLMPTYCCYHYRQYCLSALYGAVTVTSTMADSIAAHSPFWNGIDRLLATAGVAFGPMATLLRLRDAVTLIELLILLVLALACLFWARSSKTFAQWRVRHTVWHVASCWGLSYLAYRNAQLFPST